ncbi:MAG TPA: ABC transporter ATP-binding protein [Thermosulfidibacter takaii]|uniref:ABC transporter ATP-binding protein n=1 Tax=Thermosulfidibacter takaii TaxID=412593 RepID=A0A7C0U6P9_9BACT|nr:ABC transporter ATP-binding protein [Thermosulfidibacter takaii]
MLSSAPILELQGVTIRFGGLTAVAQVDLTLYEGEILGLIGPNGAGKTTLFNIIAGFHKPSKGRILFKGRDITGMKPHKICKLGVVRTFQIMKPLKKLTTLENVMVGALAKEKTIPRVREKAQEILKLTGLDHKASLPAGNLTPGEKKRLEVARALATDPSLILLDEVMGGLTPPETQKMLKLLRSLQSQGISMVVVEHNVKAVVQLAHRITVLNYGKKIAEGLPHEVLNHHEVIEAYMGEEHLCFR